MAVSDAIGRTLWPFGDFATMKKIKPLLIGAIAGSVLMFVSLQFHLIRSEDGFRLVPRTPQPSLGLFFVDLRDWTPEDYADVPELARALVASGNTDLVASSVSERLLDDVSESGSSLEQLRGFMNDDRPAGALQIPDGVTGDRIGGQTDSSGDFRDLLLPIFDTKKPASNQIARADDLKTSGEALGRRDLPSIDSIFGANRRDDSSNDDQRVEDRRVPDRQATEPLDPFRESNLTPFSENSSRPQPSFTASEESDIITDMLFGDEGDVPISDTGRSSGWQDTVANSRDRIADEVRNEVATRAGEMANEFRGQLNRTREQAFDQTLENFEDYSSRKIKQSLPSSIGDILNSGSSLGSLPSTRQGQSPASNRISDALPPELEALQKGFDPFLK